MKKINLHIHFLSLSQTADEFLEYLMSCVKIDAEETFLAVQQVDFASLSI